MSNNTLSFTLQVNRSAVNRGEKDLNTVVTLSDVAESALIEQKLPADTAGISVGFGPVTTASGVVIYSTKKIGVIINGGTEIECGSMFVLLDTNITSVVLDNDVVAGVEHTVEVWLVTQST